MNSKNTISTRITTTARLFSIVLLSLLSLFIFTSCGLFPGGAGAAGFQRPANGTNVVIDWLDFIQIDGITYFATSSGGTLKETDLGSVYAILNFKLAGNVHDPAYQARDGDAAVVDAGTPVYTVRGYQPTFRLAVHRNGGIVLYEAESNPHGKKGVYILDVGGVVVH